MNNTTSHITPRIHFVSSGANAAETKPRILSIWKTRDWTGRRWSELRIGKMIIAFGYLKDRSRLVIGSRLYSTDAGYWRRCR